MGGQKEKGVLGREKSSPVGVGGVWCEPRPSVCEMAGPDVGTGSVRSRPPCPRHNLGKGVAGCIHRTGTATAEGMEGEREAKGGSEAGKGMRQGGNGKEGDVGI